MLIKVIVEENNIPVASVSHYFLDAEYLHGEENFNVISSCVSG